MAKQGSWPDLSSLGGALRVIPAGEDNPTPKLAVVGFDMSAFPTEFQRRGMVYVSERQKFSAADLERWFPGFSPEKHVGPLVRDEVCLDVSVMRDPAPAPQAASEPAEAAPAVPFRRAPRARIEDAGQKIGGARKDFAKRHLAVEDLLEMNSLEVREVVRRDNVWPPMSMKEMKAAGYSPVAVVCISALRRQIPPKLTHPEDAVPYIQLVETVRDAARSVKDESDRERFAKAIEHAVVEAGFVEMTPNSRGGVSYKFDPNERFGSDSQPWSFLRNLSINLESQLYRYGFKPLRGNGPTWELLEARVSRAGAGERNTDPTRPHLDHLERAGLPDDRDGEDVTAERFMTEFGFRAVEFGNWLPQDERQKVLNLGFDACSTLARVLGVPRTFISLDGTLAAAFGARGRGGKAAAHYERSRRVFNLTRLTGAGCLAHEWFHALDHSLGDAIRGMQVQQLSNMSVLKSRTRRTYMTISAGVGEGTYATALMAVPVVYAGGAAGQAFDPRGDVSGLPVLDPEDRAMWAAKGRSTVGYITSDQKRLIVAMHNVVGAIAYKPFDQSMLRARLARDYASDCAYVATWVASFMDKHMEVHPTRDELLPSFLAGGEDVMEEAMAPYATATGRARLPREYESAVTSAGEAIARVREMRWRMDLIDSGSVAPVYKSDLSRSEYLIAALHLDKKKAEPYWSAPWEAAARAFEAYVETSLARTGQKDDYLVHGTQVPWGNAQPYPQGAEREAVCAAYEALVSALRDTFVPEDAPKEGDTVRVRTSN